MIENSEPRDLLLAMLPKTPGESFTEVVLQFDNVRKCSETKEHLDFKKKDQVKKEKALIEKYLIELSEEPKSTQIWRLDHFNVICAYFYCLKYMFWIWALIWSWDLNL